MKLEVKFIGGDTEIFQSKHTEEFWNSLKEAQEFFSDGDCIIEAKIL